MAGQRILHSGAQRWPPGIKACRWPESFKQRRPQTSFSPNSCILQMRKPRLGEGQGRPQSKGSGVLSKHADISTSNVHSTGFPLGRT